ncbi:hypothetical protein HY346_01610 [Candidatus Microgenomates bacterium]|nr:hypothetical protein [Candidatus Microgenomates bacterium]
MNRQPVTWRQVIAGTIILIAIGLFIISMINFSLTPEPQRASWVVPTLMGTILLVACSIVLGVWLSDD